MKTILIISICYLGIGALAIIRTIQLNEIQQQIIELQSTQEWQRHQIISCQEEGQINKSDINNITDVLERVVKALEGRGKF